MISEKIREIFRLNMKRYKRREINQNKLLFHTKDIQSV